MDQVGILFNSASQAETPTRDADFKNLLHLVSTLLDAIKEKIVIESEDIKKILDKMLDITIFLEKRKNISQAEQYHHTVIQICKELKNEELKSIKAAHNLALSDLDRNGDILIKNDVEEKETLDGLDVLLEKLNEICQASSDDPKPIQENKAIADKIKDLKIKFLIKLNIELINAYPLPGSVDEGKSIAFPQKIIENVITQTHASANKQLASDFVYAIIQKTLKSKSYSLEWKRKLLCALDYAYQIGREDGFPLDDKQDWLIYHTRMRESREQLRRKLGDQEFFRTDSRKRMHAAQDYSAKIHKLLQDIATNCNELVYLPPVEFKFSLVALGSLTRKELLPYSDLECLLLAGDSKDLAWEAEKPTPAAKYLQNWFRLFQFYIVSFGETLDDKPGFRLDGACSKIGITNQNLTKGNPKYPEFRKTVKEIFEALRYSTQQNLTSESRAYLDPSSVFSLLNLSYIGGNDQNELINDYYSGIQKWTGESEGKIIQKIARQQLKMFNNSYETHIESRGVEKNLPYKIKTDYWQLLVYPLYSLSLDFNLIKFHDAKEAMPSKSTLDVIALLEQKGKISSEQAEKLQTTIADLYQIRFNLHEESKCQQEIYEHKSETGLKMVYLEILHAISDKYLKELYRAIEKLIKTNHWTLGALPISLDEIYKSMADSNDRHENQMKLQGERIAALEKKAEQHAKQSITWLTPVYHVLLNDLNKRSRLEKLEGGFDKIVKFQSHFIAYLDDLGNLRLVSTVYEYGNRIYKVEYELERLLSLCQSPSKKGSKDKELEYENQQGGVVDTTLSSAAEWLTRQTPKDNDCALHAVLGEWNSTEDKYICSNIDKIRSEIKTAIHTVASSKEHSPLKELIFEGIKALIMEGKCLGGESSKSLFQNWQKFQQEQNQLKSEENWQKFRIVIEKFPSIVEFINKHGKPSGELTLQKYSSALNVEDGELKALILSLPNLEEARRLFDEERSKDFKWESSMSADIMKEYGNHIGVKGQWLLPHELGIIAIIFKVSVYVHASIEAKPQEYNKEQKKKVHVLYDRHHYERLESAKIQKNSSSVILSGEKMVQQYIDDEKKTRDMEFAALASKKTSARTDFTEYEQVTFNHFVDFCTVKYRFPPHEDKVREALKKLLSFTVEECGKSLGFTRNIDTDRAINLKRYGGQTVQFKFAWSLKEKARKISEIMEECAKLETGHKMLTILFHYYNDGQPVLTGYVQNENNKKIRNRTVNFMALLKVLTESDKSKTDPYEEHIKQFWKQPTIKRKWQDASIKLLEQGEWLRLVFNLQSEKKIAPDDIQTAWLALLERSAGDKKVFRTELQRDEKLNPKLNLAANFVMKFLLFARRISLTHLDYREEPDLDNLIIQNKLNQKLIQGNIMLLKKLYKTLISFRESAHFNEIAVINKLPSWQNVNIDEKITDTYDSAITILYVVLTTIKGKWDHRKKDHGSSKKGAWFFSRDPWQDISRHICGDNESFSTIERSQREKIINNISIFTKELEEKHDFSRIKDADAQKRLYNQCEEFFNKLNFK